ncbi:ribosome small subunit-dependent GTPase A [Nocardiopsis sp. LOL_012]|uniref:ribosome small subunit-dependent GTPase A n=1 Tax=Nocardiopsis sp. LOL_012 TaxID=3345409 RepID=UPI003A86A75B
MYHHDPDAHASHPLTRLGWTDRVAEAFDALVPTSPHTLVPARVAAARRGGAEVLLPGPENAEHAPAVRRAARTDPAAAPTSGDWVALRRSGDTWLVEAVLERSSSLVRQGVAADSHDQVLAANVDGVLICEAADQGPNPGRLERFLSLAWSGGSAPTVAVTKADLAGDRLPEALELAASVAPGADVHPVSAHTGEGVDALARILLPGSTWVFLGTSGAGKSSLVNAIAGRTLMATGEIRQDKRGRHTTTHRQLLVLPGGALVLDIPGLRRVDVTGDTSAVDRTFDDIRELAELCRFADCSHGPEPGCAVTAAAAEGDLDPARLGRWNKLRREAERNRDRTEHRLRARDKQRTKTYGRIARDARRRKGGR